MKLVWTVESLDRLAEIQAYIARDNPVAAERFVAQLIERTNALADFPQMGRIVPEHRREDVREIIEKRYRIVYAVTGDEIVVLTVFEGHRRMPPIEINARRR